MRIAGIAGASLIVVALGVAAFFMYGSALQGNGVLTPEVLGRAHQYGNSSTSLEAVRLKVIYAVPKNRVKDIDPEWHAKLDSALKEMSDFHSLQFRGFSRIVYDVFHEPLLLRERESFYDTTSTARGNPHGLINVSEEVFSRALAPGGDSRSHNFDSFEHAEYQVLGIVYEGVGASGGVIYNTPHKSVEEIAKDLDIPAEFIFKVGLGKIQGFFLLNREYLDKKRFSYGSSVMYHEFAHAIGIPDSYEASSGRPMTDDVMGAGRERPLTSTYLDDEILRKIGVLSRP